MDFIHRRLAGRATTGLRRPGEAFAGHCRRQVPSVGALCVQDQAALLQLDPGATPALLELAHDLADERNPPVGLAAHPGLNSKAWQSGLS